MTKVGLLDLVAIKNNTPMSDVLDHYDLQPDKPPRGDQAMIHCPFHEDGSPSCSVNLKKGIFKCFGCPEHGNVLEFIALMEGFTENRQYQAAVKALDITSQDASLYQKAKTTQRRQAGSKKAKPGKAAARNKSADKAPTEEAAARKTSNDPINVQLILAHDHPFLGDRGITPEVAETFGIGHCRTGIMKNRIAIPIHNANAELVAFTGRWAGEGERPDNEPRYKLPKGFEKSLELFNLHRAAAFEKRYVVVVEGIWSAIRLHEAGVPAVALLGTSISEPQAGLLAQAGFTHAMLILDGDEAGRKAAPEVVTTLSQTMYVKTLVLPDGVKPDTMDESIVSRLRR